MLYIFRSLLQKTPFRTNVLTCICRGVILSPMTEYAHLSLGAACKRRLKRIARDLEAGSISRAVREMVVIFVRLLELRAVSRRNSSDLFITYVDDEGNSRREVFLP